MFSKEEERLFTYELSKGINLFLGAGFSVLPNSLNEKLPNAKELCEEVCAEFEIDDIFKDDLYTASEMVPVSEYQDYLRRRFKVEHGINNLYYLLDKLNIKNIITTNIDNIVPTIYDQEGSEHYIHDIGLYGSARQNPNCIQYITLNGNVCNPNSHLYFGKFELTQTEQKNEDLFKRAYTLMMEMPVLFWGYSFGDNGVIKVVNQMLKSNKQNNIWVQCRPDDEKQIKFYRARGCKVITADTLQLFQWIEDVYLNSEYYKKESQNHLSDNSLSNYRIPKQYSCETNEKEDYYRLGKTCWYSIYNNHAFETNLVDRMWTHHLSSKNVVILGHKFSGKTTALMQCAVKHSDEDVFFLEGDSTPEEIKGFLSKLRNSNAVVFIKDISKDIESFCILAASPKVSVIATSDKYSFESIRHILVRRNIVFCEESVGDLDEDTAKLIYNYMPPSIKRNRFVFKKGANEEYTFFELLGQNISKFMSYEGVLATLKGICHFDDDDIPSLDIQLIALTVYLQTNGSYMSTDLFFSYFNFSDYHKEIVPFCDRVEGLLIDTADAGYDQDYFSIRSEFFLHYALETFSKDVNLRKVYKYMIARFVKEVPKSHVYRYDVFVKKAYDSRLFYEVFGDDMETALDLYDYLYNYDESPYTLQQKALCLSLFHRSKEAFAVIDSALSYLPNNFSMKNSKAEIIYNANKSFSTEKAEEQLHKATDILEECRKNDKRQNYHAILYAKIICHLNDVYPSEKNYSMLSIARVWLETIDADSDKQIKSLIQEINDKEKASNLV